MIIIIGAEKGGVGKTLMAFTLAAYLSSGANAKKGAAPPRVVLVDTDTQRTSSKWAALRGEEPLSFLVVEQSLAPAQAVIGLAQTYDAVVVDVGARDYKSLAELARIADLWIAPTRVGQGDLMSSMELGIALDTVHDKHKDGRVPLCFLVNAVPGAWNSTEGQDAVDALTAALPSGVVLKSTIRDRKIWRDAHKLGRHLFEMAPAARERAEKEFLAAMGEAFNAFPAK